MCFAISFCILTFPLGGFIRNMNMLCVGRGGGGKLGEQVIKTLFPYNSFYIREITKKSA